MSKSALKHEELSAVLAEHSTSVQPDDPMAEAGRKLMLSEFITMLAQEEGARTGEDIEHVHDMRVAIRRMRSVFKLLANYYNPKVIKPYRRGLRSVMQALGEVRDLDVMIHDLTLFLPQMPPEQIRTMQSVIDSLDQRRGVARAELVKVLDSKAYRRLCQDFGVFLTTPEAGARPLEGAVPVPNRVRHVVPPMIYERLAEVRAYDAVLPTDDMPMLHQLRIAFKGLRYTVSLFDKLMGPETGDFISELKAIQDHLGRLNDIAVAHAQLGLLMADLEGDQSAALWLYLEHLDVERPALIEQFPAVWKRFNSKSVRRKLALAVLNL
jgi:CHAD domain-containing protein